MEPRIQYAKTKDGVSIAYWTMGEGMPLVYMPTMPSHIQREWQWPGWRAYYEGLTRGRKLVRYDGRGSGLSDRDVTDYSLDAHLLDLEAVVDRLGLERFALLAVSTLGPAAIAYAARHPQRVSHLLLWAAFARNSDYFSSAQVKAARKLRDEDWETYTETAGHIIVGWSEPEEARQMAAHLRESWTQETAQVIYRELERFNVSEMLVKVESPSLVIHPGRVAVPTITVAKSLASAIPDARLVVLEDTPLLPWVGDMEAVVSAIDEFLGEGEEVAAPAPSGLVTILFTDMESSTALRQRLGDTRAQELVRTHNTIVRDALKAHDGSEIKHTGDGIMASFPGASGALECAVAIQRGVAAHVEQHPETPLRVYIGLNAGEPIAEEKDLFGTSVDLARRICDRAGPGEILVSDVVRQLAAGKGFLFSDRGDVALRGFEDPVRLYDVRWREEG